jgi:hypothetical protein
MYSLCRNAVPQREQGPYSVILLLFDRFYVVHAKKAFIFWNFVSSSRQEAS